MAIFSFFNSPKPKQFNFKPRYYDAHKERLKEVLQRHEDDSESNPDMMKSRISMGFKSKGGFDRGYESKIRRRSNRTLLLVLVVLVVFSFVILSHYLPELIKLVE